VALLVALAIGYGVQAARSSHHAAPAVAGSTTGAPASSGRSSGATMRTVALSSLPPQAAATVALIQHGGPYPYSEDGTVFANDEHLLPTRSRGYYHEYTVTTPGASTRATRRIVTGSRGEFYYTDDHYESFVRVDVQH